MKVHLVAMFRWFRFNSALLTPKRVVLLLGFALVSCTSSAGRTARDARVDVLSRTIADSVFAEQLAPGVRVLRLVHLAEPWRAGVLDVDLNACVSLRAVKGANVAVGRATTSALLTGLDAALRPIAAVNADFFLFAPPGVPTNAHVERGRVLSGPIERAVFAMTTSRRPWIGVLSSVAALHTSRGDIKISTWNRPTAGKSGVVDAAWGIPMDSVVRKSVWLLMPVPGNSAAREPRYVATPLPLLHAPLALGDTMLLVGLDSPGFPVTSLVPGDTVRVSRTLSPIMPMEAVGGQPDLMRDSVILGTVDSVSSASFRGLNPRTAVGYADGGRRVLIAVIDGRQAGYSVGMSLRQTAELLRALGATHAINLDGGGSSVMVVTDPTAPSRTRKMTHPSDSAGERPVANALAVLGTCGK